MRVFLGITALPARRTHAACCTRWRLPIRRSACRSRALRSRSSRPSCFDDARLSRDETLARFTEGIGANVTIYEPNDWKAPYASGSAKVDAYVICPCSMGTLGTIASGAMQNLIHRAASVALRKSASSSSAARDPLSTIHLENMLTLRRAGATILFLAPGFYHGAESVDDLVDFVVARILDHLGLDQALTPRWGQT